MELDSLKYIWQTLEAPPTREDSHRQILALMQRRSAGPLAKMRRNLNMELILIIALYTPTILLYFFLYQGRLAGIGWLFIGTLLLFTGYFYRKNRLLKEMQCVGCQVRSNLQRQVRTLTKYTRFYILTGTLLIPIMTLCSYAIIRWKYPPAPGAALFYQISRSPWWQNPLFLLVPLAIITVGIYYANAWYVGKLYGRHIKKLQDLLREMDAD